VLVEVAPPPPPVILSFGATPTLVQLGKHMTLAWQTKDATTVTIAPGVGQGGAQRLPRGDAGLQHDYVLQATGPGGQRTATVDVTVNHPPVAVDDTAFTDSGVETVVTPLTNDSDPDGDTLEVCGLSALSLGHANVQGTTRVSTRTPGYTGTATFTYRVCDGKGGSARGRSR